MTAQDPITLDEAPGVAKWTDKSGAAALPSPLALTIVWSHSEPDRVGELACFATDEPRVLGRGMGDDGAPRVTFQRARPDGVVTTPPLEGPTLSRRHARIARAASTLDVSRLGRGLVALDGEPMATCQLSVGQTLQLSTELILLCERRPTELLPASGRQSARAPVDFPFGAPDALGLVGETPQAWELRAQIHFAGAASASLLVTGSVGAGREAVARAVHSLAPGQPPLVAIDGSALRSDDVEALAGREDAPVLLVIDVGDVPGELQNLLVRFATRLQTRPLPRVRLIATTTSESEKVRPALAARFPLAIRVPDLAERRADIPLIARALLEAMADEQPQIGERYFEAGVRPVPRMTPNLARRLVQHGWPGQVPELHTALWRSAMSSAGDHLDLTPEVERVLAAYVGPADAIEVGPEAIRLALAQSNNKVAEAARRLGLSRFQLYRLMDKYAIKPS